MGVLGELIFGWLADHIEVRVAFAISAGIQAPGMLVLIWTDAANWMFVGAGTFGLGLGLGLGGMLPLHASLVGKLYGPEFFAGVLGLMAPAMLPTQMLGIPLAGWLRDVTGSYELALQIFAGAYVLAMLIASEICPREADITPV